MYQRKGLIRLGWLLMGVLLLSLGMASPAAAHRFNFQQQFVPNSQSFWDNSKNWTTNYGPAYRDTVESPSQLLACSTQFALCFHSGAAPYPCTLDPDGRSAHCKCTVSDETNYTLITAILNYQVYLSTVQKCGADGSNCPNPGDAPVCNYLDRGALIPGADVISTFDMAQQITWRPQLMRVSQAAWLPFARRLPMRLV
jgi:hypothetical protein